MNYGLKSSLSEIRLRYDLSVSTQTWTSGAVFYWHGDRVAGAYVSHDWRDGL